MFRVSFLLIAVGFATFSVVISAYYPCIMQNDLLKLKNNTHNLVEGCRVFGDRLLAKELVVKKSSLFRKVTTELQFPPIGQSNNATISLIVAEDLGGGSAQANITSGGVGLKNVKIRFKSKRSEGIHYNVTIYGY